MAGPPVVGIPLRPARGDQRQYQNTAYFDALIAAGAVPIGIPLHLSDDALRAVYERCNALVFAGGPDVDPREYGEEPDPACNVDPAPVLDETELRLARWATADDLPVLGICRGAQLLNVALGGSLYQDIAVQCGGDIDHDRHDTERDVLAHSVEVDPDTVLGRVTGGGTVEVNSLHHQGINRLGDGLVVTARAPDGVVEGAEDPSRRFLVLVQSHPEELAGEQAWARRLFNELVAAAG